MNQKTKDLVSAALCVALGLIVPQVFHLIPFVGAVPNLGGVFLPMHIPVLLCGLICGWQQGAVVGFVLPLLRSALFGAPAFYPMATGMAFELMTYGLVAGLLYGLSKWHCLLALYRSLVLAMLAGRVVWGIVQTIQMGVFGNGFTLQMFLAGAFINAIPGILAQLILIPAVMLALGRTGLVPFKARRDKIHEHTEA